MLVAALANRLSCPLVSGDSDFFVVEVTHGVVAMESLLPMRKRCARYRAINLSKLLKLPEHLLPMLAVTMGNDYSEENMLYTIQTHCGAMSNTGICSTLMIVCVIFASICARFIPLKKSPET